MKMGGARKKNAEVRILSNLGIKPKIHFRFNFV